MRILNLTQHPASHEQQAAGVIEPENKKRVQELLTFDFLPSKEMVEERATDLATIAVESNCEVAMIGGAGFLISALERALKGAGIKPVHAFSRRESVEEIVDGKTIKKSVFRHVGFVPEIVESDFAVACSGRVGWFDGQHPDCCGNCVA
jgi:hypothetical protein